jgi:membrane-associated phospholipid phosphatase
MRNLKIFKILLFILFTSNFANAQNIDIRILREINLNRNQSLDPTFKAISKSVSPISVATPALFYGLGLIEKDNNVKQAGIFMGETFLVNAIITTGLKKSIKRDRPFVTYPDIDKQSDGGSYSFPSGHTSTAFSTATSLSMAFPKWYVVAPSFLWATAVGYSRMDLGVHYPSDVLAGVIVGCASAFLSKKINQWINKKTKKELFFTHHHS